MQETVTNTNDKKSLFSSFLEVLEAREEQAQADRQLQEEKYLRRTRRIYEFHDRQRQEAVELRRYLEYVSQHASVVDSVLRGGGGGGGGGGGEAQGSVPLMAALVRQSAALNRCIADCIANACRIRQHLPAATRHQPQMDLIIAKMEADMSTSASFLERTVDATFRTEMLVDNLRNMIAEMQRRVRDFTETSGFRALCGEGAGGAGGEGGEGGPPGEGEPLSPAADTILVPAPADACSTPIARD